MHLGIQEELFRLFSLKHSFLIDNHTVFRKKGYQDIIGCILLLFCKLLEIALEHTEYFQQEKKSVCIR